MRVILQQPALPKYRIPVFRELARRPGIDLTVVYGSTPGLDNATPDGFEAKYVPLYRGHIFGEPVYWHAPQWDYATREKADALIVTWDLHYAALVPGLLRAKANDVATIAWGHAASKDEIPWQAALRRKVGQLATATLFYNGTIARRHIDAGYDPRRVFVAQNSLDQAPIEQAKRYWLERPGALEAFRQREGIGGCPTILFVSRLDHTRKLELLLQATATLREQIPNIRLVIIGKGDHEPALRREVDALDIAPNVRFVGALYEEAQLAPWFLSATVFAFPNSMGLSLPHAFGSGLPVVTSDRLDAHGPEIESLRHGRNGLLFKDGDVGSLVEMLARVLRDPALARRLSEDALRTVTSELTLSNMVDGFEQAIRFCARPARPIGAREPTRLVANRPTTPPAVAVIANAQAPYRIHVQRRIARELPVKLWTVFTHDVPSAPWESSLPDQIGPLMFGRDETVSAQSRPIHALHEWRKGGKIIEWMGKEQVQAVVVQGYNDLGRLRIIRWCCRNDIPCFLWGDSNIRNDHAAGVRRLIKRVVVPQILSWCSGALACGSAGRAYFEKYGVPSASIYLFPLEPDYRLIDEVTPDAIEAARARYGMQKGRRFLVFSGRLVGLKRLDLLIDAFAALADRRPEWDLIIVGSGPLEAELRQRVPAELRDRVIWTGFIKEQAQISAIYRASDVLVLPSEREAWALVINEAAAAGLAIVSSSIPGAAAELVRDGVNGRIFPSGDLQALIDALQDVTSTERLAAMKAASREVLEDWRRQADPVDGLRQVLQRFGILPNGRAVPPAPAGA
jgi:glycosyltransferase involved in cell wall biosynthesis